MIYLCGGVIVGLLWIIAWLNYQYRRLMQRYIDQFDALREQDDLS